MARRSNNESRSDAAARQRFCKRLPIRGEISQDKPEAHLSGELRMLYIRCKDWNLALASCGYRLSLEGPLRHKPKRRIVHFTQNLPHLQGSCLGATLEQAS